MSGSMSGSGPKLWVASYYPAFDGLRALAVLLVFVCHYITLANHHLSGNLLWVGVDLFFVLSGFLITGILLDTRESAHYFRNFYIRRSLRILPLAWGIPLLVVVFRLVGVTSFSPIFLTNFLFVSNFLTAGTALGKHADPSLFTVFTHLRSFPRLDCTLGPFWSLCVEEHFYALWPLIIYMCPARSRLLRISAATILLTVFVRCVVFALVSPRMVETNFLYTASYARFDALMVGAWLALWLRDHRLTRSALVRRATWLSLGSAGLLFALLLTFALHQSWSPMNPVFVTVGHTLVALTAAGVLMLALDESNRFYKVLCLPSLRWLGRISFGFYVLHALLYFAFQQFTVQVLAPLHLSSLILPIAFIYTTVAAALSYRYFEMPFLRLKSVFAPRTPKAKSESQGGSGGSGSSRPRWFSIVDAVTRNSYARRIPLTRQKT